MTARARPLAELPDWPLMLNKEEAARYVGVSLDIFDMEILWGVWPAGRPRGEKGGKLTWCRLDLDERARSVPNQPSNDDYEGRRNAYEAGRQQPAAGNKGRPQAPRRRVG